MSLCRHFPPHPSGSMLCFMEFGRDVLRMNEETERRGQPRLQRDDALFVPVGSANGDAVQEGQTVRCSTENVSPDGLRLRLPEAVPEGTIVELWVRVTDRPGTFLLKGMTKWAMAQEDGSVLVGIQLAQEPAEDIGAWRAMVAETLGPTGS